MQRRTWWFLGLAYAGLSACGGDEIALDAGGAGTGSAEAGTSGAGAGGAGVGGAGTGGAGTGAAAPRAGESGTPAGSGASAAGGAASGGETLTAKIVARNVPPDGQEHVCVVVELANAAPVWVTRVSASLSGGSHHLIVDRRPASTALRSEPQVCMPTMASDTSRLIIAQQKETSVQLPPGVAFKLEARQRLFLQLHYFNLDPTAHDITGTVTMHLVDPSAGAPVEAKNLFTGSMQIDIPAAGTSESKAFYVPPAPNGKRHVFALTSHTHRLGVRATIERVASMAAPAATPLHESTTWSEPPLTVVDPPLAFTGKDGLRLTCRYKNDTDSAVHFGVEAEDEMCFMWLYYYDAP